MPMDSTLHVLGMTLEVLLLDILLSGDNAIVIALACRRLAPEQRRQVLVAGTGIAVVLRVMLALLASVLLRVPLIKLAGGVALIVVAVRLLADDENAANPAPHAHVAIDTASALRTVVIADAVMSVDNVMALAALSPGNAGVMALGVALSAPLLAFGSWFVARVIATYPLLEPLGAALLGWIAGGLLITDPLYARSVQSQSPLLAVVVPALAAVYVLLQARIVRQRRGRVQALRPARKTHAEPAQTHAEPAQTHAEPAQTHAPAIEPVPAAAPVAPARRPPAARAPSRTMALPWVAAGVGVAAATALVVFEYADHGSSAPMLHTYDCGTNGVTVSYLPGSTHIRLNVGTAMLDGKVGAGNQIRWNESERGAVPVGISPPDFVTYGDADRLGLGSERGASLECKLR